jgi:hypothetical protein
MLLRGWHCGGLLCRGAVAEPRPHWTKPDQYAATAARRTNKISESQALAVEALETGLKHKHKQRRGNAVRVEGSARVPFSLDREHGRERRRSLKML